MFYQLHHLGSSEYFRRETGENFSFSPHLHQCFELIVLLSGSMEVSIAKKTYILKEGDTLLIFPNQIHSLESKNSKHMLFIFSPKLIEAFSSKTANAVPKDNSLKLDRYIIDRLFRLSDNSPKTEIKGLLYLVCAAFEENAYYLPFEKSRDGLLSQIFVFVDNNFKKECSLQELSGAIGYNYDYLSRYFKKIVGISYNEYVNICRINHAGYLLKNTRLLIIECSAESGYSSLRSFNRNFKEIMGITPTEYRDLQLSVNNEPHGGEGGETSDGI